MFKNRYAVAPTQSKRPSEVATRIHATISYLIDGQTQTGGYWGEKSSLLDRLICTCHVTMALQTAGYEPGFPAIKRAANWLASPEVSRHNNSYWRTAPLHTAGGHEQILSAEIENLRSAVNNGASPHPDQIVENYLVRIMSAVSEDTYRGEITELCNAIFSRWNSSTAWQNRADSTTDAFSALRLFSEIDLKRIRPRVITLLGNWYIQDAADKGYWQNEVSTAYVVMNCVESGLVDNKEVEAMCRGAVEWLWSQSEGGVFWAAKNRPYGGEGDIQSDYYPTGAIIRSIIAFEHWRWGDRLLIDIAQCEQAALNSGDRVPDLAIAAYALGEAVRRRLSRLVLALIALVFVQIIFGIGVVFGSNIKDGLLLAWQFITDNEAELGAITSARDLIIMVVVFVGAAFAVCRFVRRWLQGKKKDNSQGTEP